MNASIKRIVPEDYLDKKIAVLSDIHSNFDALNNAVDIILQGHIDKVVVLGDLLTYGCQVKEVLDLLKQLEKRVPCLFIIGNHDEFYFDLQAGAKQTRYKVPDFIQESIDWNLTQLDIDLRTHFIWHDSIAMGPVFLSHANPFGSRNWQYLNTPEECFEAVTVLGETGFQVGIFGHTHRKKNQAFNQGKVIIQPLVEFRYKEQTGSCYIVNPGSVGQPRGEGASMMVFEITAKSITFEHIDIEADLSNYFRQLAKARLSEKTTEKLLAYFGDDS